MSKKKTTFYRRQKYLSFNVFGIVVRSIAAGRWLLFVVQP